MWQRVKDFFVAHWKTIVWVVVGVALVAITAGALGPYLWRRIFGPKGVAPQLVDAAKAEGRAEVYAEVGAAAGSAAEAALNVADGHAASAAKHEEAAAAAAARSAEREREAAGKRAEIDRADGVDGVVTVFERYKAAASKKAEEDKP